MMIAAWILLGLGQMYLVVRWRQAYTKYMTHERELALFRAESTHQLQRQRIEK